MKQLITLFILATVAISSFAQNQYPDDLVVEGKSSVKLIPEQLIFNVRISVSDSVYSACTEKVLKKAEMLTNQFTKNGIDKDLIKTLNYSIREVREYDNITRQQVFKGYQAEIPVMIKTVADYPKNDLIFEIIKTNFNADFTLLFALTPKQKESVKEKLIELAVEDAKQKAKIIAKSAEIKIYGIRHIQYGEPQLIGAYSRANYELQKETIMIRGAASSVSDTLNPSEIEMSTSVIIAWRI
jgi:hypothetical protein